MIESILGSMKYTVVLLLALGVLAIGKVAALPARAQEVFTVPAPALTPAPPTAQTIAAELQDGDLVRTVHNTAVWVIKRGADGVVYRRWLIAPQVVAAYGFLIQKPIRVVPEGMLDAVRPSYLVRRAGDTKVYETWNIQEGVTADLRWIPTEHDFYWQGFSMDAIFTINDQEFHFYRIGSNLVAPTQAN